MADPASSSDLPPDTAVTKSTTLPAAPTRPSSNSSPPIPSSQQRTALNGNSPRPDLPNRRSRKTWSPAADRPGVVTNPSVLALTHREFNSHAQVSAADGRVHISVNALKDGAITSRLFPPLPDEEVDLDGNRVGECESEMEAPPKLNIVIMVIGSRGDVQPFIAIAMELKEKGHRVRLATHGAFREFVGGHGVEFFDIGGDPAELMSYMVRNPGLIPNVETIKAGDVAKRREQMYEMFQGFWRSCIMPDDKYDPEASGGSSSRSSMRHGKKKRPSDHEFNEGDAEPFVADAIIANPPSFAHVHCAEKLGIPLHLMFTFPYSPTQEIPHPLAFIQNSNLGSDYTNALTYPMVEMLTWQGLGDLINDFRVKTLSLEPVATLWAPGMISRLKVPFTYMWSPALIPKPKDWGPHIDITGFVFLDQTKDYDPPEELTKFLEAGPPPIYIGFGSIVVDDPDKLTNMLFDAIKATGVRALVSKGWGGLGGELEVPENVHMLGNCPHDWLFEKVEAVIHHGGAGTTAIGLFHGKPTMVVPFFGDQTFWGAMIHNAGAGPEPVPHKELTSENLAEGIRTLLLPETKEKAQAISRQIREDDGNGAKNAVKSFYKGLQELESKGKRGLGYRGLPHGEGGPMGPGEGKWDSGGPGIRCAMLPEKVAVWKIRRTRIRLSAMAASWLVETGKIEWKDLRLIRHTEWSDFDGPGEPLSGGMGAFFGSIAGVAKGIVGVPYTLIKGGKRVNNEVDLAEELAPRTTRRRIRRRWKKHQRHNAGDWTDTEASDTDPDRLPISKDVRHGTKRSVKKIARSVAHAPLDVSLAVAQGFHNAPRLYGDQVRRPARITGFHSGARAAGKEFALGIYDGFSGLVLQPYHGARDEGPKGVLKGVGRGFGGLILKTQAGVAGVMAFTLKGIHREFRKGRDRKVLEGVMRERRRQGVRELRVENGLWANALEDGWTVIEDEVKAGRERRSRREARKEERNFQRSTVGQDPVVPELDRKQRKEMRRRAERGYTA